MTDLASRVARVERLLARAIVAANSSEPVETHLGLACEFIGAREDFLSLLADRARMEKALREVTDALLNAASDVATDVIVDALSPPSTGGESEARTYSQAEVDSILKAAFPFQTKSERAAFLSHPSPEMGEWRPEVRAFADLMEAQLRANDHKPGWKDDTDLDLFERLGQESAELLAALRRNAKRLMWGDSWVMEDTVPRVGAEAADVANFAMMIADVCGALKLKENGLSREGLT